MENKDLGKTSTGIQPNVAALLSYLLGWVTGVIFFLIEKDNKFVRYHAIQSIVVFGALSLVSWLFIYTPFFYIGWSLTPLINLVMLVLWIFCMIKSYQGEKFKIPVAGDLAEKYS